MSEELVFDMPMLVSAIILVLTFGGVFTEHLHHIHRAKVAMMGAAAMVISGQIFGFYNPEGALEAVDWNVVILLGAMMSIISVMIPTGGFQALAYWIARVSRGQLFVLMAMLAAAISVISMLLDNVTTVVIFAPLIILIAQALCVNPIPYLMAAAMLANIGGVATLVGDPSALMIGSSAGIDFNTFFLHMGPVVAAVWITVLFFLRVVFRKRLAVRPTPPQFTSGDMIKDKKTWYSALSILFVMIFLFLFHHKLHWEPWVVSVLGLTMMLLVNPKISPDKYISEIELSLLLFFVSLFVVIGGVEHSGFLTYVSMFILPFVENDMLTACILLIWVAGILSALIDNIPFAAAMIPVIAGLETHGADVTPLWWALAIGAGMGGNGSHIGASANIFVYTLTEKLAERESKASLAITPGLWFKAGTPAMLLSLLVASIIMAAFFPYYSEPFERTVASHTEEVAAVTEDNALEHIELSQTH